MPIFCVPRSPEDSCDRLLHEEGVSRQWQILLARTSFQTTSSESSRVTFVKAALFRRTRLA
jgi:hypothetical protein